MVWWLWIGLILLAIMSLVLASFLNVETLVTEQKQSLVLRCLQNSLVIDAKQRELSWYLFRWRVLRKPFTAAKPKRKKDKRKESKARQGISFRGLRQEKNRFENLWRYFKRSIHVEHFDLDARLATPDPVWTSTLYALAASVIYPLKAIWPNAQLYIQPDFAHDLPSGSLKLAFKARVFRLVVLVVKTVQLVRKLRQGRNRKEKTYGSSSPSQRDRRGYASSS